MKNPDWQNPAQAFVDTLVASLGAESVGTFDAEAAATEHPLDCRLQAPHVYMMALGALLGYYNRRPAQ